MKFGRRTVKGRVVYNEKTNKFKWKDLWRIYRHARDFYDNSGGVQYTVPGDFAFYVMIRDDIARDIIAERDTALAALQAISQAIEAGEQNPADELLEFLLSIGEEIPGIAEAISLGKKIVDLYDSIVEILY